MENLSYSQKQEKFLQEQKERRREYEIIIGDCTVIS